MKLEVFARLVTELTELDDRIGKAKSFLSDGAQRSFNGAVVRLADLPDVEIADLNEQLSFMVGYRFVLARRIARNAEGL